MQSYIPKDTTPDNMFAEEKQSFFNSTVMPTITPRTNRSPFVFQRTPTTLTNLFKMASPMRTPR